MNFRPELAEAVMAGTKTVTRRLVSENPNSPWARAGCALKVGRSYAVCPGRGKAAIGRVWVVEVTMLPLGWLTHAEASREGCSSPGEFEELWRKINGGLYDPQALVHKVTMQREPPDLMEALVQSFRREGRSS